MTRWSQYDEDEHRLPEGMRRVGYDADTQTYSYQDTDGSFWEGEPGNRYGTLHPVSSPVGHQENAEDEDEDEVEDNSATSLLPPDSRPKRPNNPSIPPRYTEEQLEDQESERRREDWKYFAPFLVLIGLVLLLLFRLLSGPGESEDG